MHPRRVAIIGARGIANYGGFETFVGEVAPRLTSRGYEVICSHRMREDGADVKEFQGVKLAYFPFRFPKNSRFARLFEVLYDWYFAVKFSWFARVDVLYCLGIATGLITAFCRLSGTVVIVNVDGLEWKRAKFRLSDRIYIRLSYLASYFGSDRLILDNSKLVQHIPARPREKAIFIPYGVAPVTCPAWDDTLMSRCCDSASSVLSPGRYWLVVARLEPDNNIHTIVDAYMRSGSKIPLAIVGSFSSAKYESLLHQKLSFVPVGKSVLLLGSIYNRRSLEMLRCHCAAYVHGHSVGGTNPSLLEGMSAGNVIISHDNEFNREVAGESAIYFTGADELARALDLVEHHPAEYSKLGEAMKARVSERYRWDDVVSSYDKLFEQLARKH
jgi:rhamnosyltransferase